MSDWEGHVSSPPEWIHVSKSFHAISESKKKIIAIVQILRWRQKSDIESLFRQYDTLTNDDY